MSAFGVARVGRAPGAGACVVLAVVVGAGWGAVVLDWRLAVSAALALPIGVAAGLRPLPAVVGAEPPAWLMRWIPTMWVAIALLPDLRLLGGGARGLAAASGGALSPDIVVQLMAALLVLGATLLASRDRIMAVPSHVAWFLLYPALVVLSTAWSRLPLYTAGRAIEFAAVGALVVLTTLATGTSPDAARSLQRRTTRAFAVAVVPLTALMFVTPRHVDGRLVWPGGHPNSSAEVVGLVVILLALAPRDRLSRWFPMRFGVLAGVLGAIQVAIGSRTATAAMVTALAILWGARAMRNSRLLALATGVGLVGAAWLLFIEFAPLVEFVMRGQSESRVVSLNGRRQLWNALLREPIGSEVWGIGMGGARGLLPRQWAGNAHNAWMDLLLSFGVVGVGLVTGLLLMLVLLALRNGRHGALALVMFAVVLGTGTTAFHQPGVALGAFALAVPMLHMTREGAGR